MSDLADTPIPLPPTGAAAGEVSEAGDGSTDTLAAAFETLRTSHLTGDDTPEIAADDAGATAMAESLGEAPQKP